MKVLSVKEAGARLAAVCREALGGEVVRLELENGACVELTPVPPVPKVAPLSTQELAESYEDAEWAEFENHCAKASD